MKRNIYFILSFLICISHAKRIQANPLIKSDDQSNMGAPTINVTKLEISDKKLKLDYEIGNTTKKDIWILSGFGKTSFIADVLMDKDDRTLLIRSRLTLPLNASLHNLNGRYFLLRAGQTQTESVTLTIPVYPEYTFGSGRQARGLEYAKCLAIEIGYYAGDLPGMIRDILEQTDRIHNQKSRAELIRTYLRGSLQFNRENEILRQRDEEILIPYTDQKLKGEQVLRTVVEGLRIPYEEKIIFNEIPESIEMLPCTRAEIKFEPSMFEYFFPYKGQQSLLNTEEKQSLQSVKTIVVEDSQTLKIFINDINNLSSTWGIVREISRAQVVCNNEIGHVTSFNIYNDNSVVINERGRFECWNSHPGLRKLTPMIWPFELRVQCGINLRNLWHRLCLHNIAVKKPFKDSSNKSTMIYPTPTDWCDSIVRDCHTIKMYNDDIIRPFICPGVEDGKRHLVNSHYSMNPNCKYDSPPDMVLLFETKAGWNQHGGPELFTFDNHEPKGGCVLLNDGTVKFIRTKEELRQLRW